MLLVKIDRPLRRFLQYSEAMMLRALLFTAISIMISWVPAFAQDTLHRCDLRSAIGFHGGYLHSWFDTDFGSPDGVTPSCCTFTTGKRDAFVFGFTGLIAVTSTWGVEAAANFSSSTVFLEDSRTLPVPVNIGGTVVIRQVTYTNVLESMITLSAISVAAQYSPFCGFRLLAGIEGGSVRTGDAKITQEVSSEEFVPIEQPSRLIWAGQIVANSKMSLSLVGGMQYALPLGQGNGWLIVADLRFIHGLTNSLDHDVASNPLLNLRWKSSHFQTGMRIMVLL